MTSIKKHISQLDIETLRFKYGWCFTDREIIFCILNDIDEVPICRYESCNHISKFDKNRYTSGCCKDHTRRITNIEKYGYEHNWEIGTSSREKYEETMQEKYGAKHTLSSAQLRKKVEITNNEKYGCDNVFQSEDIKEKIKQSNLEKYGVENPQQCRTIKEKTIITLMSNIEAINATRKITLLNRYGIENINQIGKREWFEFKKKSEEELKAYFEKKSLEEITREFGVSDYPVRQLHNELFGKTSQMRMETSLINYIKKILPDTEIIKNTRKLIPPLEIDLYVPDKKIAIEFNGVYWHTECVGKDNKYHLNKTNLCESKGVRLLHITDKEWLYQQNIIKSILRNTFNVMDGTRILYARTCEIRKITILDKNKFLKENHLQGDDRSKVKYGAFYNDELVAVMTFRKPLDSNYQWEISRLATKVNTHVVGIAQRMFNRFLTDELPTSIITFSDKRFFSGKIYEKLGFVRLKDTKPNFKIVSSEIELFDRRHFQRHLLEDKLERFDSELTAWENLKQNGYTRMWDCGNHKFEWRKQI